MRLIFLTVLAMLALSSCIKREVYVVTESCSLDDLDDANLAFRADQEELWTLMRNRLYRETMQPVTEADRKRVVFYEGRLRYLDNQIGTRYNTAVSSCKAFQECRAGRLSGDVTGCAGLQGDMLTARSSFYALDGDLDGARADIMKIEPLKPGWIDFDDDENDDEEDKPSVRKDDTCTNVSKVFTVGCDKD